MFGATAREVGQKRMAAPVSTFAFTNGMTRLLGLLAAIRIGWTRPAFRRIISYVVKRLRI